MNVCIYTHIRFLYEADVKQQHKAKSVYVKREQIQKVTYTKHA